MTASIRIQVLRLVATFCLALPVVLGVPVGGASAKTAYKVLYWFCQVDPQTCQDGQNPTTGLVEDAQGNVFGGVGTGGPLGSGGIFKVSPKGKESIIYSFCSLPQCADGQYSRDLIMDAKGAIWGTTSSGGAHGQGIVYKLSRVRKVWKLDVLYDFCSKSQCSDGSQPWAGLTYAGHDTGQPYDGVSPLYGATIAGGANNSGVAFKLDFGAGRKKLKYRVIYDFCSLADCADGTLPYHTLTADSAGNVFGTAITGQDGSGSGLVFELSPNGDSYRETVLHSFCSEAGCTDGSRPLGVTLDSTGALFGVTGNGGTGGDAGLVFRIVPNGQSSQETVLYNFCTQDNCDDGGYPATGVVIAPNGDLYGTATYWGGEWFHNSGLVYRIRGTAESVVHPFCTEATCPDGSYPIARLLLDESGTLYGTTEVGGPSGNGGVLFRITKRQQKGLRD
jgi:uncharacterized repeat protein (TIGR03803 family)